MSDVIFHERSSNPGQLRTFWVKTKSEHTIGTLGGLGPNSKEYTFFPTSTCNFITMSMMEEILRFARYEESLGYAD